jgi:hypothetical protein
MSNQRDDARRATLVREAMRPIGTRKCREDVESVFKYLEFRSVRDSRPRATKLGKLAAKSLRRALRRAEVAAKNEYLDWDARRWFPREEIKKLIGICDELEKTPSSRPAPNARAKKLAAIGAHCLLRKFDEHSITTTKGGAFCRLAAVLYGNPDADLQHHCRAVKRQTGSKKLPVPRF